MTNYPELRADLQKQAGKMGKELPGTAAAFGQLHKSALAAGALETKNKELIALGISITTHCQGCIAYHTYGALHAGATREEVLDAIGVAVMMGGGPAWIYSCEAYTALDQYMAQQPNAMNP